MKIRQGAAPSVLYRDGKKVWEFTAGHLDMRPFDPKLYALLLERGAEPVEAPPAKNEPAAPAPEEAPEPETPRPSRKRKTT